MLNDGLQQQLADKEAGIMNRQQKKAFNTAFNGAYKSWFHLLTGNSHFGRAILRHGYTSPAALSNLLAEYQKDMDSDAYSWRLNQEAAA